MLEGSMSENQMIKLRGLGEMKVQIKLLNSLA